MRTDDDDDVQKNESGKRRDIQGSVYSICY